MAKPASGTALDTGHALYTSLEAAWGMLEGSGGTSADSRNSHTLTLGDSATWGTAGAEVMIDIPTAAGGTAQPLAVASPFTLAGTGDWTVFARLKMSADDNLGVFIGDKDNPNDFIGLLSGSDLLRFRTSAGTDYDWTLANLTTEGNVAVVRSTATGKMHAYVNGTQIGTGLAVAANDASLSIDTVGNGYSDADLALDGYMKCCYVWSGRALDATDIGTTLEGDPYVIFAAGGATPLSPATFRRRTRFFRGR